MNTATAIKLETSFLSFFKTAHRVIEIKNEEDYKFAIDLIEHLMTKAEDREGEPLLRMIDMVADAIDKYESNLESMSSFIQEVENLDPGVSTLRVLINQHKLSYSDLKEEIGSKSLVSQILSGSKNLTRAHIANLTKRFSISPELFF
ncbi:MAG: transcriptional regulator [Desulfuromonadales bacterium]|nr:transcriptional regulator [Desulfuromonadales bacterium]